MLNIKSLVSGSYLSFAYSYKSVTENNTTTVYVKQQFKAYCNKVTADNL